MATSISNLGLTLRAAADGVAAKQIDEHFALL